MGWLFGIPSFDLAQRFTYFDDLMQIEHNTAIAAYKKENLYQQASSSVQEGINSLTDINNLNLAIEFLYNIALSERNKELNVIKAYAQKAKKDFPFLKEFEDPDSILQNPDAFYTELTAALNEARRGTKEYLTELYRIYSNIQDNTRTLETYKQDDYRYRVVGDIESFLRRLNGSFGLGGNIADETSSAFTVKVQQMVMRILEKKKIPQMIQSGADFAAIAAATLIDIEREVQQTVDEQIRERDTKQNIATVSDQILQSIEDKYLKKLERNDNTLSPVQRAINDIQGIDFSRITNNAKQLLGLSVGTTTQELTRREKNINQLSVARNKKTKSAREAIREIRQGLKRNKKLSNNLLSMNFSISGSVNSKHGTIYELIESMMGSNIQQNTATDIITYDFGYKLERNDAFYDSIIAGISENISASIISPADETTAHLRDLRNNLKVMNANIRTLIKETEKQIENLDNNDFDKLFIYHETLKLYSSAETGRNKYGGEFKGRTMNILSFIDYMDSAQVEGFSLAVSRDLLNFLALNLNPGAVAKNAVNPLQNYFSIFAGLLMFDDIQNIALEAAHIAQSNKVQQIHLYNLNGIYVPASMLLSYVSDAVSAASNYVANGIAAQAIITVPQTNAAYEEWKAKRLMGKGHLSPIQWNAVGADSASSTKVTITFLAAFKDFIEKLNHLS